MRFIKNILLSISSILVLISLIQVLFHLNMLKIIDQNKISRNIIFNLDYYFFTFYPDTHDKSLSNYVAVIGDSYAVGQGDSSLKKKKNYSAIHLIDDNNENYLNFAKPGARSLTSIKEFFFRFNLIKKSFFLPNIDDPKKVLIFFYSGNDINDNFFYYKKYNNKLLSVDNYVSNNIEKYTEYNNRKFKIFFPVLSLSKNIIIQNFIHYIYLPFKRKKIQQTNEIFVKKKYNKIKFSKNKDLLYEGDIINNNPGYLLPIKDLNISLDIFFSSVKFLKKKLPDSKIEIIYIPSPTTIYNWNEDSITINLGDKIEKFSNDFMKQRYEIIIEKFHQFSKKNDILFKNSTFLLQEAAKNSYLHGELDPNHFNLLGYKIISEVIIN